MLMNLAFSSCVYPMTLHMYTKITSMSWTVAKIHIRRCAKRKFMGVVGTEQRGNNTSKRLEGKIV